MLSSALLGVVLGQSGTLAHLEPVLFTEVSVQDNFWSQRMATNATVTVNACFDQLEKAGNLLVMKLAAEGKHEGYKGLLFTDSDLYKVLEGASYVYQTTKDPAIDRKMDEVVALIAKAQMPDGYLDTWFQVTRPNDKYKNTRDWHELYCAGHMFEAAVAHHRATGKRTFLDIALKLAERIYKEFGPDGKPGYCGHPEIELALIKLWKDTGDKKWFNFAERMVMNRGSHYFAKEHNTPEKEYDGTYWLDDVPITEHKEIKGHAVRAAYLLSGACDVARENGNPALLKMLRRVWRNATEKRIFITGGIGPSASNEGFTVDYDLPNESAYQETCATIAMALWGSRMALLYGDAQYADTVETSLYNGLLSGISWDGKGFFYVNPLASEGGHHRSPWFSCACCPPNVLRTIANIGGYAYAKSSDSLYVNLYIGGKVATQVGGKPVEMRLTTNYPWDGRVTMGMDKAGSFALRLRKPGWCQAASIAVNGEKIATAQENGYWIVRRNWVAGDRVELDLEMPIQQIEAHPGVKDDVNRASIRRGPLVYCAEEVDNDVSMRDAYIPRNAQMTVVERKDLFGGIITILANGHVAGKNQWRNKLYQPVAPSTAKQLTFIPYGFWDNRKAGKMNIWFPTTPPSAKVLGLEGSAAVTASYQGWNSKLSAINDGVIAEKSSITPPANFHFWSHKGGEEWVEYTWEKPVYVSGIKVFWFDDRGYGECRLPESWKLQTYRDGKWADLGGALAAPALDRWSEVSFAPTWTTRMRLVLKQQGQWSSGIHEWQIVEAEEE